MGDPTGGLFGLASSAGGGGGGDTVDPNATDSGGGGGSPFDPSAGMGGGDPSMGGGAMGAVDTAAPGVDPGIASLFGQAGGGGGYDPTGSATAQQQIGGAGNLGSPGQPPTDQPSAQAPQRYASAAGTPDVTPKDMGYQGLGPRTYTQTANLTATPGQPPTPAPDIAHAFAGSGPDAPGIHWDPIEGNPQYIRQGPSVTVSPEESQTGQHGVDAAPPGAPKYAPPATAEGTGAGDLTTDAKGNKIPGGTPITTSAAPPATPPAAMPATVAGGDGSGGTPDTRGAAGPATDPAGQQGQQAGMGRMPQSPLEQLIGQLLHPLEQMIMRALGINPNALFHAFQGGNPFNRQAGPGYYPPGTRGGQTVQGAGPPSLTPAPAQSGGQPQTPPGPPPGTPGTPGNQPSATPPGRREGGFDPTLPGYPYTGETRDQPPPWYRGEQARPDPNMPGEEAHSPVPPPQGGGIGAIPDQGNRPRFYSGNLSIGGQQFRFGSGGGHFPSLPYGTYYLHPGGIGAIGHRIGAIAGISDSNNPGNNTVNDPQGRGGHFARTGVEVHPDVSGGAMRSNGCIAINRSQWGAFSQAFRAAAAQGPLTLTVKPDGSASIQPIGEARTSAIRSIRYQPQMGM